MKRMMTATLIATVIIGLVSFGLIGCTEKTATSKREIKISTPGGTTTITTKKEIKKTGDNPPPIAP